MRQERGPLTRTAASYYGAGLGFEDCSARVDHLRLEDFADNSTFVGEHQWIAADAWRYYSFKLHERDYQVVVNVAGEGNSSGELCA